MKNVKIPEHAYLVSLDVTSLYPSIPNHEGLKAVRKMMNKYPDPKRPDNIILNLLEICLTRNTFTFNGKNYIQTSGCAMGHPYCVAYANIYMANWEEDALSVALYKPFIWFRFIDDIFMIWLHGIFEFFILYKGLNGQSNSIKLTFEIEQNSINFLDITFYKGPNFAKTQILDTKVYFKPTNSLALLHKHSHHPNHVFKSVVKSQVLRYSRICNNLMDFENATSTLFQSLYKRG